MNLSAKDCSPFEPRPSAADSAWLGRLAAAVRHDELIIRLEEGRDDEPIVYCERDGSWWAGRYVGSVTFEGRRLDIRPRFGEESLRLWFSGAFNLAMVDTQAELIENSWFVPWLLAIIWSRSFVEAARHGLPAVRTDIRESGLCVRGRLDISGTVLLRAAGIPGAASFRREKSLNNPISCALVAAYAELSRWLGARAEAEWLPERVKDLLPHLIAAVGSRPKLPTQTELNSVKLTPITSGFRSLAELSVRIASRQGLVANASDKGECKGVMLDVAELWELYVIAVLRRAWPGAEITHGTHHGAQHALLSNDRGLSLGFLKPDAIVCRDNAVKAVLDAKYKRLWPTHWSPSPQREDMYQLAAYLGRYSNRDGMISGALVYPFDPKNPLVPPPELGSPWKLDPQKSVRFITLPHDIDTAACKIRSAIII